MMDTDFGSIEDLIEPQQKDNKSAVVKLQSKMQELELEELEKETEKRAAQHNWGYIDLRNAPLDAEAIKILSLEESKELGAVVLGISPDSVKIATLDPQNEKLLSHLHAVFPGKDIYFFLISLTSLDKSLLFYSTLPKIIKTSPGILLTPELIEKYKSLADKFEGLSESLSKVETTELVAALIAIALGSRASDIHIEPQDSKIILRIRIDGVLIQAAELPREKWLHLISRIKLVSGLKLNIIKQPQDGRFTINLPQDTVDVRVSTLPTSKGESVAMRILRSSSVGLKFEDLGISGKAGERVLEEILKPNGMIVVCGPTGSGKTTTLYAILTKLNTPENNIITLENPVEYHLKGINQSQIDPASDYTFANGLRSILRQDPDIVMVGEMRDEETVDIAINAALTGHLLLSTLHTNQAIEAIPRFFSLGAKPFLLAPALNCIIAQRLVRILCDCKIPLELDSETMSRVREVLSKIPERAQVHLPLEFKFYGPKGCQKCKNLGYFGRTGIYEILLADKEFEASISEEKISSAELEKIAYNQGMVRMVQDGLLKALDGITSVEEVFRVIG